MVNSYSFTQDKITLNLSVLKNPINGIVGTCYTDLSLYTKQKGIERGYYNGYVIINSEHPYYDKSDLDLAHLEVHGNVTYARFSLPCAHTSDFCAFVNKTLPRNVYVIGFDCTHAGDTPSNCDLQYVLSEIEKLRYQLEFAK